MSGTIEDYPLNRMLRVVGYDKCTDYGKFLCISMRMDAMFSYEQTKHLRSRYASTDQMEDEYGDEAETYVAAAFQILKDDYLLIRDAVMIDETHKHNANVKVLENIIHADIERELLGESNEHT